MPSRRRNREERNDKHDSRQARNDVLIVGGGLAGLSAAAHAARAGASVTAFEKGRELGGRGSTQERDGFLLNQGAHALYRAGIGRQVLADLGIDSPGGVPSPAGGFALAGGVKHTFPGGFVSLLSTELLSWAGKLEVAKVLATLPRMDTTPFDHMSVADAAAKLAPEGRGLIQCMKYLGASPSLDPAADERELEAALDLSESDVKVTLHRVRRALQDYDRERCIPTPALQKRTHQALETLVSALATGDMRGAERLLAESVVALSAGGGEFFAARVPILGRERVFKFYSKIARHRLGSAELEIKNLNSLPALVGRFNDGSAGQAPRIAQHVILDRAGRIRQILSVLATPKLSGVRFPGTPPPPQHIP